MTQAEIPPMIIITNVPRSRPAATFHSVALNAVRRIICKKREIKEESSDEREFPCESSGAQILRVFVLAQHATYTSFLSSPFKLAR